MTQSRTQNEQEHSTIVIAVQEHSRNLPYKLLLQVNKRVRFVLLRAYKEQEAKKNTTMY